MRFEAGIFEAAAHDEGELRRTSRKAIALATRRADVRFRKFLSSATSKEEFESRSQLIEDDLREAVESACEEVGHEHPERVLAAVRDRLAVVADDCPTCHGEGQKLDKEGLPNGPVCSSCNGTGTKQSSVKTARRPKMCPYHKEVTDIALSAGDPTAGYNAMSSHAWSANHCEGPEFEGRCNFKPEMVTQSYWDDKKQQAEERRQEREQLREQELQAQPEITEEAPVEDGIDSELSEAPSAIGEGEIEAPQESAPMPMAASRRDNPLGKTAAPGANPYALPEDDPMAQEQALHHNDDPEAQHPLDQGIEAQIEEAKQTLRALAPEELAEGVPEQPLDQLPDEGPEYEPGDLRGQDHYGADKDGGGAVKTVKVDEGSPDTPSPKIDKRKWTPENVKKDDAEMDGSPHPTEDQDVLDKPEYGEKLWGDQSDIEEKTDAVLESQDLPAADDEGYTTEKNIEQPHTDTWSGDGHQTQPVASRQAVAPNDRPGLSPDWGGENLHQQGKPEQPYGPATCPTCKGSGNWRGENDCPNCDGSGVGPSGDPNKLQGAGEHGWDKLNSNKGETKKGAIGDKAIEQENARSLREDCDTCLGTGKVERDDGPPSRPDRPRPECPDCQGSGKKVAASEDVDKNPIRELIDSEFDGFIPQAEVQEAIEEAE